jgi:hypothetical protein
MGQRYGCNIDRDDSRNRVQAVAVELILKKK